jgi:tetratricopeptide (TPR) repeat protein
VIRPVLARLAGLRKRPRLLLALAALPVAGVFGGPHLWAYYHLAAGRSAVDACHHDEARDHLRRCLSVWPGCVEARLLAARAARRAGDLEEAARLVDECRRLAAEQDSGEVALEWALLQASAGNLDGGVEEGLQAHLEKDPARAPLVWEALAEGHRRMCRTRHALACLEAWLARHPGSLQAVFVRAEVQRQVGAVTRAADDYRTVLQGDPARADARRPLAGCLLQVGRYEEALGHLEVLRRRRPDDAELLVQEARCRFELGQKGEAEGLLGRALAARPDYGPALRERGRLELSADRPAQAEGLLRQAVRSLPHDYPTVFMLADALRRQRKGAEARARQQEAERLKDALERVNEIQRREMSERPFDPALRRELGGLLLRLGQKESGLRWLRSALPLEAENAATHAALAAYYEQEGDTGKAAAHRRLAGRPGGPPPGAAGP